MDTGSTLYKQLQITVAKRKRLKRKAATKKAAATRKENQRIRNKENGHGYLTDKQVQQRIDVGIKKRDAWRKRREEGRKRYFKKLKAETAKKHRELAREKREKAKEKEKEKRRKERAEARERVKRRKKKSENARKRMLKHPIWMKAMNPYRVYVALNGHCLKTGNLGRYKTIEDARGRVKELLAAEKDIIFEKLTKTYKDGTMESRYEYVIFKDLRDEEAKPVYLKNEYGKYVEHNVKFGNKNYEIVEKCPAKVEDTLWVYGYDPRTDRKTFAWIFDNILNEGFTSPYDLKRIYLYHNKVVFCNDNNDIDIIICKVAGDAVRFYNTLQKYCKKGPYLFMGAVTTQSALCESLEKLLVEKTGWTVEKLRRNQHRF